ncbi:hypothetical protein RhiirA1_542821 [Rhizophagus irregularis]|uniref:Uncharacterized protein n=1 Tax=Rhizophagus irregularis TaxID=588596 RepID=A0A2N0QUA9_9GLOM|nr:hypothetical protein RhiirA1_542821 [Rhizophagus irregularis]
MIQKLEYFRPFLEILVYQVMFLEIGIYHFLEFFIRWCDIFAFKRWIDTLDKSFLIFFKGFHLENILGFAYRSKIRCQNHKRE